MFFPESQVKIWLYTKPTDMRKSFHGLAVLAKNQLHEDPSSGHVFVFINKRRNYVKMLYYDRSGYCLWAKRLEAGQFHFKRARDDKCSLSMTQLKLILEGLVEKDYRQYKRFIKPVY